MESIKKYMGFPCKIFLKQLDLILRIFTICLFAANLRFIGYSENEKTVKYTKAENYS